MKGRNGRKEGKQCLFRGSTSFWMFRKRVVKGSSSRRSGEETAATDGVTTVESSSRDDAFERKLGKSQPAKRRRIESEESDELDQNDQKESISPNQSESGQKKVTPGQESGQESIIPDQESGQESGQKELVTSNQNEPAGQIEPAGQEEPVTSVSGESGQKSGQKESISSQKSDQEVQLSNPGRDGASVVSVPRTPTTTLKPLATNIKTTTITDFQPDVCKDFLQTGYCGYGDTCKFLHVRDESKQKRPLEKDWLTVAKGKTRSTDETVPYRCVLCKNDYQSPVKTVCGHIYCQRCFMDRYKTRKRTKCFICGTDTGGTVQPVSKKEMNKLIT